MLELFRSYQIVDGITPRDLEQDVKTHWNSTEFMITSFLNLKVYLIFN